MNIMRLIKHGILIISIIVLSFVIIYETDGCFNSTYAAITKQPALTQIEVMKSSKSYQKEYVKVTTPKEERYVIYVSGKVNKNIKRLCLRIKKHKSKKSSICVFITPNSNGEFHIKINTKKGNKKIPTVLNKKGTVTRATKSKYTQPGYKPVPNMSQGLYHLYIAGAITKSDADISKSNWYNKSLGGSEGYIYKEGLLQVKKNQNNNLKLVKYQDVINNNNEIKRALDKKSYHIESYAGSHVRYKDPYLKDFILVFYNPEKGVNEPLTDSQVAYIDKVAGKVTSGAKTNYQKAVKIYEYVAKNYYYDNLAFQKVKNQYANPYNLLYNLRNKTKSKYSVNGKVATTCQGYAGLVAVLARAEGIPARIVGGRHIHQTGTVWSDLSISELNRITHYWVELYINGEWKFVDARSGTRNAWGRSSFSDTGSWVKKSVINYAHFDSTPEQISNSFVYLEILPGSKDGKYINRKNEVVKLQNFLNAKSKNGIVNGKNLNKKYSSKLFDSWGNKKETYIKTDGYGQVSQVVWPSSKLYGDLDLSDFNKLAILNIHYNDIKKLNLKGCSALKYIYAYGNDLTKFDSTASNVTATIKLLGNKLSSAKFNHNSKKVKITSTTGGSFGMAYSKSKDKVLTIVAAKPATGYRYLGIFDANGKCLSKERTYSFNPRSTSYAVKYEKSIVVVSATEKSEDKKGIAATVKLAGLESLGMHKEEEYFFPTGINAPDALFKLVDFLEITDASIDTSINGRQVNLKLEGEYSSNNKLAKWVVTPIKRERYEDALKELSSYLDTSNFETDDSYIIIPHDMYLQIGDEKISFEKDVELKIDKIGAKQGLKKEIKFSFKLETDIEYDSQIKAYIPEGTVIRMGESAITFNEATVVKINGMSANAMNALSLSDFRTALKSDHIMYHVMLTAAKFANAAVKYNHGRTLDIDIYTLDIGAEAAAKIEDFLDLDKITTSNYKNAEKVVSQVKTVYSVLNDKKKADLKVKVTAAEKDIAQMKAAVAMTKKSVSGAAVKFVATPSKNTYANITTSWKGVSGAKYQVKLYRNGKLLTTKYTSSTKYKFNGYKRGYNYTAKITPYLTVGSNKYYGNTISTSKNVYHKAPVISVKTSENYKQIKASDRNSTGYQVYISKDKYFKKNVKKLSFSTGTKALNKKITTSKYFKNGRNYVKVRAYTKYNGKTVYGAWSKSYSTIYHTAPSISVKTSGKYKRVKATDRDSTGYQIYISKNKSFNKNVKKIKIKTSSKALNKKLSTKKYFYKGKNYVKVRAYTSLSSGTAYGEWSKVKSIRY